MSDIDNLAASAYADGTDPIKWAETIASNMIMLHHEVTTARATNPNLFPGVAGDVTRDGAARRIIGALLNAGWSPPTAEQIRERTLQHAAALRASAERLRAGDVPQDLIESCGPEMFATDEQRRRLAASFDDHADQIEARQPPLNDITPADEDTPTP